MPRTVGGSLLAHLAGDTATLALLWKITPKIKAATGYTSAVADIVFSSFTYKASTGVMPSTIKQSAGKAIDNLTVMGIINASDITEADLLNGVYDDAYVEIMIVNYKDLSMGAVQILAGYIGEIRLSRKKFEVSIRSLIQRAAQYLGRVCVPSCDVKKLGDTRCKVSLAGFTFTASVTSVVSSQSFSASGLAAQSTGYFNFGTLLWTSGVNSGSEMEVKTFATGTGAIVLLAPMPLGVVIGDNFTIIAGCDRTLTTCRTKFGNILNFRGMPYIPGVDKVIHIEQT